MTDLPPIYFYLPQKDWFEVSSIDDAINVLKRFKDNPILCQKFRENSQIRAKEVDPQNVLMQWRSFITNTAVPKYQLWRPSSQLSQQLYWQKCY